MSAIKTHTVPALYNALSILELLTGARTGLTLSEIVEQCNLAKSSIHYLLVTLERCGYVLRNGRTGRYMLSAKLFTMGNCSLANLSVRQFGAPYLFGLRMRTGLTAHLAILERGEAVVVAKQAADGTHLASWIGKRMAMHCTAVGKAMLAYLTTVEVDLIIRKQGLARHNENTIASLSRLHEELKRISTAGYALDNEEDELGVRCVGVPILTSDRRPIGAVSLAGTTQQIDFENVQQLVRDLNHAAKAMSRSIPNPTVSVMSSRDVAASFFIGDLMARQPEQRLVETEAPVLQNLSLGRRRVQVAGTA